MKYLVLVSVLLFSFSSFSSDKVRDKCPGVYEFAEFVVYKVEMLKIDKLITEEQLEQFASKVLGAINSPYKDSDGCALATETIEEAQVELDDQIIANNSSYKGRKP